MRRREEYLDAYIQENPNPEIEKLSPTPIASSGRARLTPSPHHHRDLVPNSVSDMQGQQGLDLLSGASEYLRNNPTRSADMNVQEQDPNRPRKRRRAALACEQCRQRKLK